MAGNIAKRQVADCSGDRIYPRDPPVPVTMAMTATRVRRTSKQTSGETGCLEIL